MWLLITLLVLLLFLIIIVTKVKVYVHYYHNKDDDYLKAEFKTLFGLIKYKVEMPLIKVDDNSPSIVVKQNKTAGEEGGSKNHTKQYDNEDMLHSLNDIKEVLQHIFSFHRIIKKFLRKVSIKKLQWNTVIGVGDAAVTGMLTGGLWAVKGSIIGILSHYMKLKTVPEMTITPYFQFTVSQTVFTCIIHFRMGHAILAGIKLVKYWKGGNPNFKTKPLAVFSKNKTKTI